MRKEPDILTLDQELGVIVIAVKGIRIEDIQTIQGHNWKITHQSIYPYQQAERQLLSC